MKRLPKLLILSIVIVLNSCSLEEDIMAQEEHVYTFKKVPKNSTKNSEIEHVKILINSFSPLTITSQQMEVITAINTDTNATLEILSFIQSKFHSTNKNLAPIKRSGWIYNSGTDCFYYGTYTYYENGTVTFTFASASTQSLMNNCGDNDNDPWTDSAFAITPN
jgi:hypothetical protein